MAWAEVPLCDHPAVTVENGGRKIVAFAHAFRECGMAQGDPEFLRNRHDAVPDYRQCERIHFSFAHN